MGDPGSLISTWLRDLLTNLGLAPNFIDFLMVVLGVAVLAAALTLLDIFLVWVERKVVGRFQDRFGPNRLGPFGLIQPFADIIKLLIKEDILPAGADKVVYNLAPIMALGTVLMLWAVIPLAPTIIGADINVAVLYIVAIGAIGSLAIIMAGWSSNNKYALLGAFRSVAMIVSYEVPMVIILLVPVILARSMGLMAIVEAQDVWFIFLAPAAALILLVTSIAELGRAPFDLAEAESEIVAGFNIEYSGMKFGLFYAGELLHAITISALISTVFLGGWRGPFVEQVPILGVFYLLIKAFIIYWVIMWIKYSFPRLRIDQMLDFCWKFLTPLALALLIVTAILDKALAGTSTIVYTLSLLAANLVIVWLTFVVLRRYARTERQKVAEVQPFATPPVAALEESLGQE
ncbi:MAG: NADH-quinone oxidoreductase subunit NuoH [Anaerolineales bacterium]|nr:NADH-quinone oxidoreductase subunit NuoH [Anaerolineales bacterium]